jgi:hypothetical protein
MGIPRHKQANHRAVGVLQMISFFVIALLCSSINVDPTPKTSTTMGITTRTTTVKDKPTGKAIITTKATPKERRSERLAKSPCTVNVNSLIAEINLPTTRFDNVLEALRPMMAQDSQQDKGLNAPCNLAPPAEKTDQITPLASPMGVNQQPIMVDSTAMNTGTEASLQAQVRISKTTTTVEAKPTTTALPAQAENQSYSQHQKVPLKSPTHPSQTMKPAKAEAT